MFAGYSNFLGIRMLIPNKYLSICSNVIDRPNHLMCHFVSCPVFCAILSVLSLLLNGVNTVWE
jgi:hypothetical protein